MRPHYARTICLHGPESTGKSTLSAPLAAHFETIWVPEYGRVHCELYGFDLDAAGLVTIGRTQSAMTRAAMPWCNRRLIVDTDALTTAAWSIMILGHVPDGVLDDCPFADLYLLTDIDIPWEDDGTRYFPAPADRRRFMAACEQVLDEAGVALRADQRRPRRARLSAGGRGDRGARRALAAGVRPGPRLLDRQRPGDLVAQLLLLVAQAVPVRLGALPE